MGRFILMRLAGLIPVLLILSIITFVLMHEVPGGPWKYGQRPFSEEQLAALKARYGLDKPVWQQYLTWLAGVVRLDFGMSFKHPDESVIGLIGRTWPMTTASGPDGADRGIWHRPAAGHHRRAEAKHLDRLFGTLFSILGFVTPHFVWGILFILIFALALKWVPTGGWDSPKQWIMPVLAYSLAPMATIARYTRASVIEVDARRLRAHGARQGPAASARSCCAT